MGSHGMPAHAAKLGMLGFALGWANFQGVVAEIVGGRVPQTPYQQQLVEGLRGRAEKASQQATPELLDLLDTTIREALRHCCPEFANKPAAELAEWLRSVVRHSEVTHNFHHLNNRSTFEQDMDLTHLGNVPAFYNLWQVGVLGFVDDSPRPVEDFAETHLLGFRNFSRGHSGRRLPASFEEASERAVYGAVNALRIGLSGGMFGDILIVMSEDFTREAGIYFPIDTGNWVEACGMPSQRIPLNSTEFPLPLKCSAWDNTPGTYEHLDHVLLAMHRMRDLPENVLSDSLVKVFERSLSPVVLRPYHALAFPEVQLVGQLTLPEGVKFIVAGEPWLFGSHWASVLQTLCIRSGWALAWTLGFNGPQDSGDWPLSKAFRDQVRVLDPTVWMAVAQGSNLTVSDNALKIWSSLWFQAELDRIKGILPYGKHWADVWHNLTAQLPQELVLSGPLMPGQCVTRSRCLGVNMKGHCACYPKKVAIMV